jgi:hypothetical protein
VLISGDSGIIRVFFVPFVVKRLEPTTPRSIVSTQHLLGGNMTIKTLSAVAARIIGWLAVLEGIRSCLSTVLLVMLRAFVVAGSESLRPVTSMIIAPIISGALVGFIELCVGVAIIGNSEYFGRILSKGLDERP